MKIKKYIAKSMPEAMNKIRKELGPDAVILNSKHITRGGFLGLFKKREIEVIAALDNEPLPSQENKTVEEVPVRPPVNQSDTSEVLSEIQHLKEMLEAQTLRSEHNFPSDYEFAFNLLVNQEVEQDIAKSLITTLISEHEQLNTVLTREEILEQLKAKIEKKLNVLSFEGITYDKKVIQFVGPTGVGKTTTLAKVAALSMIEDKKKVAFITTDTYRIAAIDQLKTYARILDVPVEVAYTFEEYKNAIKSFEHYDLILVDTAGRNYRETKYINELQKTVNTSLDIETYLVLSLTSKAKDIVDIFKQFESLTVEKLIFTKLDETRTYGSLLNICLDNAIGVSYITNGQDVPDDIIQPDPSSISNLILGRATDV